MRIMSGRSPFVAGLAALALTAGAAAEGPTDSWQGRYRYEHDGGQTASGSPIHVTYELAIGPSGARGGCLLSGQGFQTDERIVCHVGGDEKTLAITFHGYPDGRLVNRHGVAVYKPGQTLVTLAKEPDGSIQTSWDAFRPDEKATSPGRYFQRVP